jgi:hypothetical protein
MSGIPTHKPPCKSSAYSVRITTDIHSGIKKTDAGYLQNLAARISTSPAWGIIKTRRSGSIPKPTLQIKQLITATCLCIAASLRQSDTLYNLAHP